MIFSYNYVNISKINQLLYYYIVTILKNMKNAAYLIITFYNEVLNASL